MSHLARVPSMQSAANFMAVILDYNSFTMSIISGRAPRRSGASGRLVPAVLLTVILLAPGIAPRADEQKSTPSPAPQDDPGSAQGASGAPAGQGDQVAPTAGGGQLGRIAV